MRVVLLALLLAAQASAPALAAYSGLMLIPTADVLAPGEVCVDYWLDGALPMGSGVGCAVFETQYGVGSHLEVGLDFDLTEEADSIALFNAKVRLRPMDCGPALAAGVYNLGEGVASTGYAVATWSLGEQSRLHVGAQRPPQGGTEALLGAEHYPPGRLALSAEYMGGDENGAMLALWYQLADQWFLALGWGIPNDRESDHWWALNLGCQWRAAREEAACTSRTEP